MKARWERTVQPVLCIKTEHDKVNMCLMFVTRESEIGLNGPAVQYLYNA